MLRISVPAGSHTAEGQSEEHSLCHFPTCEVRDACNTAAHTVASANSAHARCKTLQAETQSYKAPSRSPITTDDLILERRKATQHHSTPNNSMVLVSTLALLATVGSPYQMSYRFMHQRQTLNCKWAHYLTSSCFKCIIHGAT